MKLLPIPEIEQFNALVDGSFFNLLKDYCEDPQRVDPKKYITINRKKLIECLSANPDKAESYLKKQMEGSSSVTHDKPTIWKDNDGYVVAWMDHGKALDPKQFRSLPEAVAELVLVNWGMY